MPPLYKIKNWDSIYENHDTRKYVHLSWVPVPVKHDGKGYKRIMKHKMAAQIFTSWILILQIAAKCPERGILRDSDGNLTARDISDKTDFKEKYIEMALNYLSSNEIGWIEKIQPPAIAEESPAISRNCAPEQNRTEQNRNEQNRTEMNANSGADREIKKDEKEKHLDYVFLTADEHDRLKKELGVKFLDACIFKLNAYLVNNEKKRKQYKNHNLVIRDWVIDEVKKKLFPEPIKERPPPAQEPPENPVEAAEAMRIYQEQLQKVLGNKTMAIPTMRS